MAATQVIDTNCNNQLADQIKEELDTLMGQTTLHNPFIDIDQGLCYNQSAANLISRNRGQGLPQLGGLCTSTTTCLQYLLPVVTRILPL